MAKLILMLPWQAKILLRPYLPVYKVHVNLGKNCGVAVSPLACEMFSCCLRCSFHADFEDLADTTSDRPERPY